MIKIFSLLFCFVFIFACAKPWIKVNVATYMQNPDLDKKNSVILATDLESVVDDYEFYKNKQVEITAPLSYFGNEEFRTWYLLLEKDEKKLRCYEYNWYKYRNYMDIIAYQLLTRAEIEGGEVTVTGRVTKRGIELRRLAYDGIAVNTDYYSPRNGSIFYGEIGKYGGYNDMGKNWGSNWGSY
jgi:hypothetical protein